MTAEAIFGNAGQVCNASSRPVVHESLVDDLLSRIERESRSWIPGDPTIFKGVSNDMRIAREEIFGPVMSTITFSDEAEALAIANDTNYGLAAAVWTRDINKAYKFARAMRAGSVYVNCFDFGDVSLPFGGYKESGFGRDKSLHALENHTQLKTTFVNLVD